MKITFLGTGTSQGVPLIGCKCEICLSDDIHDKRLRSSILIQTQTTTIVIDSGPDFRQQMLRANVESLSGLVFTHAHKDHIAGMDDVRAFNFIENKHVEVFATESTQTRLKTEFDYAFNDLNYPGIPKINLNTIDKNNSFTIGDITLQPIEVMHYKMPVLGFRINDFTYITDANYISPEEMEKIFGTKYLVLNALRKEKHISHFTLDEAIEISKLIKPNQTYFTHISHQLGKHQSVQNDLEENYYLAYDMLSLEI